MAKDNFAVFFDAPVGGIPFAISKAQGAFTASTRPIKTRRYPSPFGSTTRGRNAHMHGVPQPVEMGVEPKFYYKASDGSIRRGEVEA